MRINTNVASLNSNRVLQLTNTAVARTLGRLSSGYRINRSADDAAGLGIANKLRADLRSLRQAARNAEQANAMLQIAEGAVQSIQSIVERMKELATQAASANTDDNGRAKIQDEFGKLIEEIGRIVETTKFQDVKLLKSTSFDFMFMVSSSGEYGDSTNGAGSDFVTIHGTELDLSGLRGTIVDSLPTDGTPWTQAHWRDVLANVDNALAGVAKALGAIGAAQNRIEHAFNNTNIAIENYAAAESTIRDADFAAEVAELTRLQILQQSGIAMLAQANAAPQAILALLR